MHTKIMLVTIAMKEMRGTRNFTQKNFRGNLGTGSCWDVGIYNDGLECVNGDGSDDGDYSSVISGHSEGEVNEDSCNVQCDLTSAGGRRTGCVQSDLTSAGSRRTGCVQ